MLSKAERFDIDANKKMLDLVPEIRIHLVSYFVIVGSHQYRCTACNLDTGLVKRINFWFVHCLFSLLLNNPWIWSVVRLNFNPTWKLRRRDLSRRRKLLLRSLKLNNAIYEKYFYSMSLMYNDLSLGDGAYMCPISFRWSNFILWSFLRSTINWWPTSINTYSARFVLIGLLTAHCAGATATVICVYERWLLGATLDVLFVGKFWSHVPITDDYWPFYSISCLQGKTWKQAIKLRTDFPVNLVSITSCTWVCYVSSLFSPLFFYLFGYIDFDSENF